MHVLKCIFTLQQLRMRDYGKIKKDRMEKGRGEQEQAREGEREQQKVTK